MSPKIYIHNALAEYNAHIIFSLHLKTIVHFLVVVVVVVEEEEEEEVVVVVVLVSERKG